MLKYSEIISPPKVLNVNCHSQENIQHLKLQRASGSPNLDVLNILLLRKQITSQKVSK